MKKTFLILGIALLTAGLSSCNCEVDNEAANTETVVTESNDEDSKCGEGKCGQGKCGGADEATEEVDHFASMDTDANGEISKEEFDAHAEERFASHDEDEDGMMESKDCHMSEELNQDGDEFISKEEFMNGHNTMFTEMDTDNSLSISPEEMEAHFESMKSDDEDCEEKCGGEDC